jgi:lipid A 3-O-deacylase
MRTSTRVLRWRTMPTAIVIAFILLCATVGDANAQQVPPVDHAASTAAGTVLEIGAGEWMVRGGPAFGVVVFHSAPGHKYWLSSVSWGRVLSRPVGPGLLRGRFQWAIELVPLFSQYTPNGTWGLGVTPLTWRWNFDSRGKVAPFAELAGGLLWTRDAVPPDTTRSNFTAHASSGLRYFVAPGRAFVASYVFHHVSNGNRLERNPGVNAHAVQVGFSVFPQQRDPQP